MDNLKQLLKDENIIEFDNEKDCIKNQHDDRRGGQIELRHTIGGSLEYIIEFNGAIIGMFKTFNAFKKRLDKLFFDWNLEFIN